MSASALPREIWPSKTRVEMDEKTSINSVYSDLWLSRASRFQGLTIVQQCVYQMTFGDVYEFKKQLGKSWLVWSRTLSTLLSMNGESISLPLFAQWANILINFTAGVQAVGKWISWMECQPECQKCEQNVFMCVIKGAWSPKLTYIFYPFSWKCRILW